MSIKISVPKETTANEKRVAASPETVKKLVELLSCEVIIESGAGDASAISDAQYKEAGAKIAKDFEATVKDAAIILKVAAPSKEELSAIPEGSLLIAMLAPFVNKDILKECAKAKVNSFSMEFVPRISRAQSMDVLSSQSNLAGYKSVLDAAEHYPHAFPMMMTAAGTIPPARVFVMGAGVAGLQAIATARRLGAIVTATDVRAAAKEQVESLGASFIAVEDDEFKQAETASGYAKPMSAAYQKKQAELVEQHISKQDIVITTALIPGRPAPKLISAPMVKSMKNGSVIVDLAVENGGNCAGSVAGKVVNKDGVNIVGHLNVPSRLAADASALYSKNLLNLLNLIIDKDTKRLNIDRDDEIIKGVCMSWGGKIVHPNFVEKAAPSVKKETSKKAEPKKAAVKKTTAKTTAKKTVKDKKD